MHQQSHIVSRHLLVASIRYVVRGGQVIIEEPHSGRYPTTVFWAVEWSKAPKPGETTLEQLAPFPEDILQLNPDVGQSHWTGGNRGLAWGPGQYNVAAGQYLQDLTVTVGGTFTMWAYPGDCECSQQLPRSVVPLPRARSVLPHSAYFARSALRAGWGTTGAPLAAGDPIPGDAVWAEPLGNDQPIVGF